MFSRISHYYMIVFHNMLRELYFVFLITRQWLARVFLIAV